MPISKGDRLIIIYIGGDTEFVQSVLTMWKASNLSGEYHNNVNTAVCKMAERETSTEFRNLEVILSSKWIGGTWKCIGTGLSPFTVLDLPGGMEYPPGQRGVRKIF